MITASHLAGFLGAHAIWSVSDGETLVPMLGYTDQDDKRILNRLAGPELGAAVAHGKKQLAANPMDANDAVLLYDGRITLGEAKVDAIIVEIRAYFSPQSEAILAILTRQRHLASSVSTSQSCSPGRTVKTST